MASDDFSERVRFADSVIEELAVNLQNTPGLIQRLGGFASMALARLHTAYVPNFEGERVVLPQSKRETSDVPVIPLRSGEVLQVSGDFTSLTPTQLRRARQQLQGLSRPGNEDTQGITSLLRFVQSQTEQSYQQNTGNSGQIFIGRGADGMEDAANTWAAAYPLALPDQHYIKQGQSNKYIMYARPLLGLLMSPASRAEAPAFALHELVHFDQKEEAPIIPTDPELSGHIRVYEERTAYDVAGIYEYLRYRAGLPPYAEPGAVPMVNALTSVAIQRASQDAAGADLLSAIREAGIDIV